MVTWMKIAVMVLILYANSAAGCCKRKGDFGCCGNGPCNVFCCNCDGGCNKQCETTSCDTGDWLKCAAVLPACAAACVKVNVPACATCLGSLYDTCKKCYSTTASQMFLMPRGSSPGAPAAEHNFFATFPSGRASKADFADAVHEAAQMHLADDGDFDIKSFMKKNRFDMFDHNGDGFITAAEACSGSGHSGNEL